MARLFKAVRAGERRDTWAAFAVLFALLASHAVLETARDALFLTELPPSRLPLVYLAIAAVSLLITELQGRFGARVRRRTALCAWTAAAAAVTFGFWLGLPALGSAGLYALYTWSGVLTTLILVHFWTLLGDLFSVTQAKRVYSVIGLGSVTGAIAGSAAAGALIDPLGARQLLLLAAGGFTLAALAPLLLRDPGARTGDDASRASRGLLDALQTALRSPYASRLALLAIGATTALTMADYLFKSAATAAIAPAELGRFFALTYLCLNVASLIAQLAVVNFAIHRLGLIGAMAVLPVLLLLGSAGALAFGGLVAAMVVKGADGALKHTLHRTASELSFVPLSSSVRDKVKTIGDVVGQRGGQAVASLMILGAVALGAPPRAIAALLAVLAAVWLAGVIDLRRHYLALFRRRLDADQVAHVSAFPELDLASMETVIAALDSERDGEVIAALDVLEREGRGRLIPSLILYHPSEAVVTHALAQLMRLRRAGVVHAIDRILDHPSPAIRAAAIATRSVLIDDEQTLRMRLSVEESAEVRAVIMVNLIAAGAIVGQDAHDSLRAILRTGNSATHIALAQAIAQRASTGLIDPLIELARSIDPEVRRAAARAMGAVRDIALLPTLIGLLSDGPTRRTATESLVAYGSIGLDALEAALDDAGLPRELRWRASTALAQFEPASAARILLSRLPAERDGLVRYGCLTALEGLVRRHPELPLDRATLDQSIASTVSRAYRYVDRRHSLAHGANLEPGRATPGHALLAQLLRDKGDHALDRLFRLLALCYPRDDFRAIRRGLASAKHDVRASSLELIESILKPPLRDAVLGLVDDLPDDQRLPNGRRYHEPLALDYPGLLQHMLDSKSDAVQELTLYHIAELGLTEFRAPIARLAEATPERPSVQRALAILEAAC